MRKRPIIDLNTGFVPISVAQTSLALLLRHAKKRGTPYIITQRGYAVSVLLDLDSYLRLIEKDPPTEG
jgi:prevent-host-death family protein